MWCVTAFVLLPHVICLIFESIEFLSWSLQRNACMCVSVSMRQSYLFSEQGRYENCLCIHLLFCAYSSSSTPFPSASVLLPSSDEKSA